MLNNRIKIFFFLDSFRIGGMHRQMLYLVKHLNKEIFEPIVCTQSQLGGLGEEFKNTGCKLIDLKWKGRGSILILFRLIKSLRREKPDIIYITQAPNLIYYLLARFFLSRSIIQVGSFRALNFWQAHKNEKYRYIDNLLSKLLYSTSKKIVVNAEALKTQYAKFIKIDKDKDLEIIYNGSDFNFQVSKSYEIMRKELKLELSDVVIVMIARLDPSKDFTTLLLAAKIVVRQNNRVKFFIVGEGELRVDIEGLILQLDLINNVFLLGERKDIYNFINCSDISVLSTNGEGFSNSILESMALSKPVVATDVGGNRELLGDTKKYGLLIPPKSPNLFAEGIIYYLENDEIRKVVGLAAKDRIQELCSIDNYIGSYEKFFKNIVLNSTKEIN